MKKYLRPGLLFLALLLLFTLPDPGTMRTPVLDGILIAVLILIPLHLIVADKTSTDPHHALSCWIIGIAGVVLTGIFWFRITAGSYGMEMGLTIRILKTFFFWIPAALFAILYRSEGESWIPGKRSVILIRLLVAVAAGLIGLAASEILRDRIDRVPLEDALVHVERQLPDGNHRINFKHEKSVLHLDVIFDSSFTEPNIHSLQRIRAIAGQASRLTRRHDTDSLKLRIRRNAAELAAMSSPDPETDRPTDRLRINYSGTGLSSLPEPGDLDLLPDVIHAISRPKNLEAALDGTTLVLRWTGKPENPLETRHDPLIVPDIIHDWRWASICARRAVRLFNDLESVRLDMPGHSVTVAADSVDGAFHFKQHVPVPDVSVTIQIFDNEEMPELPEAAGNAPLRLVWGDGEFDTRHNRSGPLWPWQMTILSGYRFYIIDIEDEGTVHFVIYPTGQPDEARWTKLQPGQTKQLYSVYLRNLNSPRPQKETDKGALKSVRRFLKEAGVIPP